jgi:hypothetical protein
MVLDRAHDCGGQEVIMGCLDYTIYTLENLKKKRCVAVRGYHEGMGDGVR